MSPRLIPLAFAVAAIVAACSKSEPPPASKAAPAPASNAPAEQKSSSDEVGAATRERLARQEAAARMFEKKALEPSPPKAAAPPAAAKVASPAPVPAPSAAPPQSAVTPPSAAAPQTAAAPAKAEAQSPPPAPKQEPPKPSPPAAAPRTDVAAARPAAEPTGPRLVSRIDPDFPREALQAGIEQGRVTARMTLDASGNVTRVEILDSNPRRIFDRAVVRALSQWRYNEGAAGRTVEMEIAFALGKR